MKTRIISLALTIVLIFGLVSACSKQITVDANEVPAVAPTAQPTPEIVVTPEPEPEPAPTPEPRNPEWTDDFNPVTGWDMMEKLGAGIIMNGIGEEMPYSDFEVMEEWHIQAIANKGFTSINFPSVSDIYVDEVAVIEQSWLDRIEQRVDWALDAGLNVIISAGNDSEFVQRAINCALYGDDYEDVRWWICNIWEQVAERFKHYPEELVFQLMCEPNLTRETGEWIRVNGEISLNFCDVIDNCNTDVLKTIRNSGGNNDKRVVILGTPGSEAEALPYMNPPDDDYIMYHVSHGWHFWGYADADTRSRILIYIEDKLHDGVPIISAFDMGGENSTIEAMEAAFSDNKHLGIPVFFWDANQSINNKPTYYDWVSEESFYAISFFNMTSGKWSNEDILEAYFAMYGLIPNSVEIDIPVPQFPYDCRRILAPQETWSNIPGFYYLYRLPISIRNHAEQMVVEFNDEIRNYWVFLNPGFGESNSEFGKGNPRITEEEGRLIIDIRGFEKDSISFAVWDEVTKDNVTRIYVDGPRE